MPYKISVTLSFAVLIVVLGAAQLYASKTSTHSFKIMLTLPESAGAVITPASTIASAAGPKITPHSRQSVTMEETTRNNEKIILQSIVVK